MAKTISNQTLINSIASSIADKAQAAETSKRLLGSSGNGGLDVFDAALAQIDLHLARLQGTAKGQR